MNKIKCEIQDNVFENFPVGTIFSDSGDKAAYFNDRGRIDMIYFNTTLSIS